MNVPAQRIDRNREAINFTSALAVSIIRAGTIGYFLGHIVKPLDPLYSSAFCALLIPINRIVCVMTKRLFDGEGANVQSQAMERLAYFSLSVSISAMMMKAYEGDQQSFQTHALAGARYLAILFTLQCIWNICLRIEEAD